MTVKKVFLGNEEVAEVSEEFVSCNILSTRVATTGPKGGDSGHGCRTYIQFEDCASTDMSVSFVDDNNKLHEIPHVKSVKINFGGDTELNTLADSFLFLSKQLGKYSSSK